MATNSKLEEQSVTAESEEDRVAQAQKLDNWARQFTWLRSREAARHGVAEFRLVLDELIRRAEADLRASLVRTGMVDRATIEPLHNLWRLKNDEAYWTYLTDEVIARESFSNEGYSFAADTEDDLRALRAKISGAQSLLLNIRNEQQRERDEAFTARYTDER